MTITTAQWTAIARERLAPFLDGPPDWSSSRSSRRT